jgi:flagellar hook-length control protein FliK
MTSLTFTDVKDINSGKDAVLSMKTDYSNIDGKDFLKALEGASNSSYTNSIQEQYAPKENFYQDKQVCAPQETAIREFVVSNMDNTNTSKGQVDKPAENDSLPLNSKINDDKSDHIKKKNTEESTHNNSLDNIAHTNKAVNEPVNDVKSAKTNVLKETETKIVDTKSIKAELLAEKTITIADNTFKVINNSSNPKSEEVSRESLSLKSSKDYLPEKALMNRNTDHGVQYGNSIEKQSVADTKKSSVSTDNTTIKDQKNIVKEDTASNKKIDVFVNEKQELLKNLVNSDQQKLSSSTQKDLEDVFNKSGAAKPVVTKLDIQTGSDKSPSQQKQGQNLSEEQTSKLTSQLFQSADPGLQSLTGEKQIVFEKILDSQISAKVNSESILDQVTQKASADIKTGKSEITMSLRPESLGKVEINLVSDKGVVTAQITAENTEVKEVLSKEIDNLKQKLIDQGINLDKVTVRVQEPAQTTNHNSDFDKESQTYDQQFQNMNNDSNFDSSRHTQGNSGAENYNTTESLEDIELNLANENKSSDVHNGMVDYRI